MPFLRFTQLSIDILFLVLHIYIFDRNLTRILKMLFIYNTTKNAKARLRESVCVCVVIAVGDLRESC